MNENINLCEILQDCPKGTKFCSYIHGEVEFHSIDKSLSHPILVEAKTKAGYNRVKTFSKEGLYDDGFDGICTLVPSLEQPDWSKWECPKPKFDPKTLKPFDKILSRNVCDKVWTCDFVSHLSEGKNIYGDVRIYVIGAGNTRRYSIPYNDDTKHLVGTTDEAPEFYKYWED